MGVIIILTLIAIVLTIIKTKEYERDYNNVNTGFYSEGEKPKGSATTTKDKAQNKRNFGYVEKKKNKFKLKKDAEKN